MHVNDASAFKAFHVFGSLYFLLNLLRRFLMDTVKEMCWKGHAIHTTLDFIIFFNCLIALNYMNAPPGCFDVDFETKPRQSLATFGNISPVPHLLKRSALQRETI